MIMLFTLYLGWLPSAGGLDRLGFKGIIMPAVSLGLYLVASHMRIVRSTMLEVLESDYIKMVRAKGLPTRMVIWKHAFKNASIPVFTLFFVNFAALISGAVITAINGAIRPILSISNMEDIKNKPTSKINFLRFFPTRKKYLCK